MKIDLKDINSVSSDQYKPISYQNPKLNISFTIVSHLDTFFIE